MAIKSRKNVQTILINMEDKRDYILSCEDIKTDYIKPIVNLFDDILDVMNNTYDSIINHKEINKRTFTNKLNRLSELIDDTLLDNTLEEDNE